MICLTVSLVVAFKYTSLRHNIGLQKGAISTILPSDLPVGVILVRDRADADVPENTARLPGYRLCLSSRRSLLDSLGLRPLYVENNLGPFEPEW